MSCQCRKSRGVPRLLLVFDLNHVFPGTGEGNEGKQHCAWKNNISIYLLYDDAAN